MKLIELIDHIAEIDDDLVIFIPSNEPLSENSNAVVVPQELLPDSGKSPEGLQYLLEVYIVKEVLDVWRKWRNGKEPTPLEKYQAFIYYVEKDAYLPPNL